MVRQVLRALICFLFATSAHAQFYAQATWGGVSAGSANALTLTIPNLANYNDIIGAPVTFVPGTTNTGPATINIDSLGATTLFRSDGTALQAGDLTAGTVTSIINVGSGFYIMSLVTSFLPSSNTVPFASSTTWTVPAGVTRVKEAACWGGGGGGGGASGTNVAGAGGAGGGYSYGTNIPVVPGGVITVNIAAGGAGGGTGGTGGTSSFGSAIVASGGTGGGPNGGSPGTGGTGSGSGAQITLTGSGGGVGYGTANGNQSFPGGGIGGSSPFGGPSPALNINGLGANGIFPGSGANGGSTLSGSAAGGIGGAGFCTISY